MKKSLVLDIDHTLIDYQTETDGNHDLIETIDSTNYFLYKRPHLDKFLDFCFQHFDVILWTSAVRNHVDFISENLMPQEPKIRLSKKQCTTTYFTAGELDDCLYPKFRIFYKSILFWEKGNTQKYMINNLLDEPFLSKHLDQLKKYDIDLNNVIAIDDDPYKFYRSFGNYFKIKPFKFDCPDDALLRITKLLTTLKDKKILEKSIKSMIY